MSPEPYVIIRRLLAALKLPSGTGNLISYAQAIHDSMKNNSIFSGSAATLTLLDAAIVDLSKKEAGCKQKPPVNTIPERDAAKVIVKDLLETLKMDVQKLADADKPNAAAIITASSMFVKEVFIRGKRTNDAENGTEPGTAVLTAAGDGAHEWRMSTDNENWTPLNATLTGTNTVTGLTSGLKYYFQNRRILRNGKYGEWSDSTDLRID
jgi:hypothetical protein